MASLSSASYIYCKQSTYSLMTSTNSKSMDGAQAKHFMERMLAGTLQDFTRGSTSRRSCWKMHTSLARMAC